MRWLAFLGGFFTLLPLVPLFVSFLNFEKNLWSYFYSNLLFGVFFRTLFLVIGVCIGTLVIGVSAAWIVSSYQFRGRKLLSRLLILPLAIPGYIYSFIYIGMMDYSGPIQTLIRKYLHLNMESFFSFRSFFGLTFVLSLSLFPYVYLLTKNAFSSEPSQLKEAAMMLNARPGNCFLRLHLPMAIPWILTGLTLVTLETLSDFGSVASFNYLTFSLTIYKMWSGFFSWSIAAQMSSLFIFFSFLIFLFNQKWEGRRKFYSKIGRVKKIKKPLKGKKAFYICLYLSLIIFFSLLLPLIQLLYWAFQEFFIKSFPDERLFSFLLNSLFISLTASGLLILTSLSIVYYSRNSKTFISKLLYQISSLGYALPGTVLALGITITLSLFDHLFLFLLGEALVSNTVFGLLWAYVVRFMILANLSLNAAFKRIPPSMDEAASSFGLRPKDIVFKIHKPLLKNGISVAFILSFVEMMKEMPMALMIRPFGLETLAVYIFQLTSEGEWEKASVPSLFIIFIGMVAVLFFKEKEKEF